MMAGDQSHMTERILNLTLEIIYLLTGEDYKVVKKISGDPLTPSRCLQGTSPITVLPPHCLRTKVTNSKKILEALKRIIELLTGEVSGAGNSGTLSSNRQGMCLDGDCIIVCVRFL
ncbi:oocyte zinc finger protein XlCOF29-like [Aquarana catesbeiana]|uniref:oocyte zinc finger protein XlCOF29-like n=1 Tax=Aquarana catesbeiana TaxID=8400 RepID=UPI003CCA64B7